MALTKERREKLREDTKWIHEHQAKKLGMAKKMVKKLSPEQEYERGQKNLTNTHLRAIGKRKADAFNIGWASGDDFITSKTDKGRITTQKSGKKYSHTWHDDD